MSLDNTNLILYYPFDTDFLNYATGSGVLDASAINNPLIVSGYPNNIPVGSGSLYLNSANNQYIAVNSGLIRDATFPGSNGLSFAFWYAPSVSSGTTIFRIGNSNTNSNAISINTNGIQIQILVYDSSGVASECNFQYGSLGQLLSTQYWHHVVITLSYSTGITSTYNGYLDASMCSPVSSLRYPPTIARNVCSIGTNDRINTAYYSGSIDDFRVYQRILSQTDVNSLYNYKNGAMNNNRLAVYYPLDNKSLLNYAYGYPYIADISYNDGSVDTYEYSVKRASNYFSYLSKQTLQFTGQFVDLNFSVAFWFKTNNCIWNTNDFDFDLTAFFSVNTPDFIASSAIKIGIYNNDIVLGNDNTATRDIVKNVIGTSVQNKWHHIVWTVNSPNTSKNYNSTWNVYYDGKLYTTLTNRLNIAAVDRGQNSFIGAVNKQVNRTPGYNGNIDDFRGYSRILTQEDVTQIYNLTSIYPCFREGTKILCFENNEEVYIPVEKIRKGTLVKTLLNSYVPVYKIGKKLLYNEGEVEERISKQLYVCTRNKYPQLFEDLYITGDHSILVKELTEKQKTTILDMHKKLYITDNHIRLMAYLDDRAEPFTEKGNFMIYHFALENANPIANYGIYANGLLVETCSKEYMVLYSKMEIIE